MRFCSRGLCCFVMGCIRNQPGKGCPDARDYSPSGRDQPAGEERKSCHCQGPGRGEDKAVPAGGEQGNAHSACGGEHSRQTGPAPVRMTQGSQQDSDGGAHSTEQHKGLSSRNVCGAAGLCRLFRSRRFQLFRGLRDSGGIRFGAVSGAGVTAFSGGSSAAPMGWSQPGPGSQSCRLNRCHRAMVRLGVGIEHRIVREPLRKDG